MGNAVTRKLRILLHKLDGKYLRPGYESTMPSEVIIEPTNLCNLRCTCCPHGCKTKLRENGIMTREVFDIVLDNIDISFKNVFLHMHGEPFINPDLPYFVKQLTDRGKSVKMSSNACIFNEKALNDILDCKKVSIIYSAELIDANYYESLRKGAKYEETLNNLDRINACHKSHNHFFSMMMIVDNIECERLTQACEMLFNRYSQLAIIDLSSRFVWPALPETGDLVRRLAPNRRRCRNPFNTMSIAWNGDATLCSFDYSGDCVVGSLMNDKFSKVFNSKKAREFRLAHYRRDLSLLPLCKNCLMSRCFPIELKLNRNKYASLTPQSRIAKIQEFLAELGPSHA